MLWLVASMTDPGAGGLDLPPETDGLPLWAKFSLLVIGALSPLAIAQIQKRRGETGSNVAGEPPVGPATPTLDAGGLYLTEYIDNLKAQIDDAQDRIDQTEARYEARIAAVETRNEQLSKQVQELLQAGAVSRTQVESLTADVIALRADNVELRAENRALRSRLNG